MGSDPGGVPTRGRKVTATLLLRIASVLALVHSILHTIGSVLSQPEPGTQAATMEIMRASTFPSMGMTRSYADFYLGLGLFVTVALAIEGILFWQLATLIKSEGVRLRPMLASFTFGYVCYTIIAFSYFFAAPGIFELLIAACIIGAIAKSK